jgi:hypothetical protein
LAVIFLSSVLWQRYPTLFSCTHLYPKSHFKDRLTYIFLSVGQTKLLTFLSLSNERKRKKKKDWNVLPRRFMASYVTSLETLGCLERLAMLPQRIKYSYFISFPSRVAPDSSHVSIDYSAPTSYGKQHIEYIRVHDFSIFSSPRIRRFISCQVDS